MNDFKNTSIYYNRSEAYMEEKKMKNRRKLLCNTASFQNVTHSNSSLGL